MGAGPEGEAPKEATSDMGDSSSGGPEVEVGFDLELDRRHLLFAKLS